MSTETRLKVVLCWHMHQPDYRDYADGRYQLPWTYLHAIKDYTDMAAIIEATPGARAVVNFVPILLDQVDDYARNVKAFLTERQPLRDPLLAALGAREWPREREVRASLVAACLRANESRLINRFPAYRRLAQFAALVREDKEALGYLGDAYLGDILVWYHLAWLGETGDEGDPTTGQHETSYAGRQPPRAQPKPVARAGRGLTTGGRDDDQRLGHGDRAGQPRPRETGQQDCGRRVGQRPVEGERRD